MTKYFQFKGANGRWPDSLHEWRHSNQIVLEGDCFETFLCAVGGAPCWTVEELEKWNQALSVIDVTVRQKSMYPRSKYISCEVSGGGKEEVLTPVKKRRHVSVVAKQAGKEQRRLLCGKRIRVRIV